MQEAERSTSLTADTQRQRESLGLGLGLFMISGADMDHSAGQTGFPVRACVGTDQAFSAPVLIPIAFHRDPIPI